MLMFRESTAAVGDTCSQCSSFQKENESPGSAKSRVKSVSMVLHFYQSSGLCKSVTLMMSLRFQVMQGQERVITGKKVVESMD